MFEKLLILYQISVEFSLCNYSSQYLSKLIQLMFLKLSMFRRSSSCLVNQVFITSSQLIMLSGWINNGTNTNTHVISK